MMRLTAQTGIFTITSYPENLAQIYIALDNKLPVNQIRKLTQNGYTTHTNPVTKEVTHYKLTK